jgi:hypothetical protein
MRLAIIPPDCYPYWFGHDNYKLILPQHWNNQHHLEASMLNHRRGGFTILDNGVAEAKPVEWDLLLKHARRYHVNEVILPDVMGDAEATWTAVRAVFNDTWHPTNHFGLMGVVQGQSTDECFDLVKYYLGMQGCTVTSIGLPRCLIQTLGVAEARYIMAKTIRNLDDNVAIHLLGTYPGYILELKDLGRNYRGLNVRGVDTSAPFVYTRAGEWIGDGRCVQRQDDYFDMPREHFPEKLRDLNIATMKEWVHG